MTRDEILNMPAGKEIDTLIAEKVMGWHRVSDPKWRDCWYDLENHYQHPISNYNEYEDDEDFHTILWHPSESILWAWEIVEKFHFHIEPTAINAWAVHSGHGSKLVWADTAPLAICRAALLVTLDA